MKKYISGTGSLSCMIFAMHSALAHSVKANKITYQHKQKFSTHNKRCESERRGKLCCMKRCFGPLIHPETLMEPDRGGSGETARHC